MSDHPDRTEPHVRALAIRMAQELDVSVKTAERSVRNLIAKGLIELVPCNDGQ